jgi:hypothetical protein
MENKYHSVKINIRENRRSNPEWTIQRHWQHLVHKTQDEDTTTQIYMTRTSLSSSGTGISIIGGGVKLVVCVQINLQE